MQLHELEFAYSAKRKYADSSPIGDPTLLEELVVKRMAEWPMP